MGDGVAKIIEPPVLMSRVLTFVLATSVVVLAVLVFSLAKMIPLERPEVFFLLTSPNADNLVIEPLVPDANDKEVISSYEEGFIRQYVIARNTLHSKNPMLTTNNWAKIVKPWSSKEVFSAFMNTALYKDYSFGDFSPTVSCSVNFVTKNKQQAVLRTRNGDYTVNFAWICENSGGQKTINYYMIRIKIQSELEKKLSGTLVNLKKLGENPLGIQVTEYTVEEGKPDPLDSDIMSR